MKTKLFITMVLALAPYSASAQIFDYKLVRATGVGDEKLYRWKFDAFVIDEGGGTLSVIVYDKKAKRYGEYSAPGNLFFYDRFVAGFASEGIWSVFPSSWDVGTGRYKPDGMGGVAAFSVSGSRVDPDYSEHGSFKFKKNTAMTKRANASGIMFYYDYVISYLESKGFVPYD